MSSSGGIKSFVSETEAEEVRKKRQEEWEKIRTPDQPLERPEEVQDNRTLYEKLQEQKDKKQEEWEEQHKFKNMFRGLDGEEAEFLDLVSQQQHQVNKQRFDEENKELNQFRTAISDLQSTSLPEQNKANPIKKETQPGRKSQADMISGAIKRKSSTSSKSSPEKKAKTENDNQEMEKTNQDTTTASTRHETENSEADSLDDTKPGKVLVPRCRVNRTGANLRQTLTITGMGIYSDSSDSESSSSDSEIGLK